MVLLDQLLPCLLLLVQSIGITPGNLHPSQRSCRLSNTPGTWIGPEHGLVVINHSRVVEVTGLSVVFQLLINFKIGVILNALSKS